ncbi:MAG: dehydrogenase [Candidatus Nanopelagicaceae bacterium]|nr:dehydrogenase [Candidatus Nanopelagicaceae bacterium]
MRVGLIGYGLAGRTFHAPLLQASGFFLAAIASRSLDKRGAAHSDFPLATILASAEELVEEELDLVVVASTNEVHSAQAKLAIDAGIPVVVDKPMALDYYETLSLFDYADARGVPITVFFNRLFDSDTLTIKELINSGELGEIFRYESRFERFRPDLNPAAWRENTPSELGGGLLLDLQTHLVSISLDLFGPATLEFSSIRRVRGGVDDDVLLVLKHDRGVDSYLSVSAIAGSPGPRVRMHGRSGTFIAKELDPQEALLRAGAKPLSTGWSDTASATGEFRIHKGTESFNYRGVPGNYVAFYNQVKESLSTGASMPVSRDFALEVAQILDRAREIDIRSHG